MQKKTVTVDWPGGSALAKRTELREFGADWRQRLENFPGRWEQQNEDRNGLQKIYLVFKSFQRHSQNSMIFVKVPWDFKEIICLVLVKHKFAV